MNAPVNIAELRPPPIMRVMTENVMPLWGQIEPLIQAELAGIPTHDAEDVRRLLLANQLHLWIQWNGAVQAMAVTELAAFPRGLALRVWLGATAPGERLDRGGFLKSLTQWARFNRCRWIHACGRMGWLRVFPDAKFAGAFMLLTVGDES